MTSVSIFRVSAGLKLLSSHQKEDREILTHTQTHRVFLLVENNVDGFLKKKSKLKKKQKTPKNKKNNKKPQHKMFIYIYIYIYIY